MMTSAGAQSGVSHFFLNLLRIGAALSFMQHGAQKLFGVLGAQGSATFATQFWLAGTLEFWGGLLILVGLFTRSMAFILAGEMVWAYFQSHLPRGFFPGHESGRVGRAVLPHLPVSGLERRGRVQPRWTDGGAAPAESGGIAGSASAGDLRLRSAHRRPLSDPRRSAQGSDPGSGAVRASKSTRRLGREPPPGRKADIQ